MRCIGWLRASPFQYAFDVVSSLNAFSLPLVGTCGPDAEIDERIAILDRVDGDVLLAGRLLLDQLDLQRLAALAEERDGLVARPHLALVDEIAAAISRIRFSMARDPPARTASRRRSRRRSLRRSAGRCRTAPSGRAASRPPPAGAPCCGGTPSALPDPSRQDADLRVFLKRIREVDDAVVHHARIRGLRETRRYRRGDIADGRGVRDRFRRPVGKGDGELGQWKLESRIWNLKSGLNLARWLANELGYARPSEW